MYHYAKWKLFHGTNEISYSVFATNMFSMNITLKQRDTGTKSTLEALLSSTLPHTNTSML